MSYGSFVRTGHAQLWMPPIGEQRSAEIIVSDTNIDLQGCLLTTLIGVPDRCNDTALVIERRTKVELRNAKLAGFKVGIYARNCENLVFDNLTFSDMFRQRLHSTPDREDTRDWLWPHNNDNGEWRTNYGACIYLENCKNCVIRNCSARGTQNGIILDKCEGCQVYNNDFSYCSGWGCALWRSSKNTIAQNRFDYCVRGYSHGVYARGQDSAGILVFEQCCDNTFAYNSATHSGDGFFLYAGHETTQRTGKGGCNRNLVYGNDFSYAVANGIEATFSEGNVFAKNRLIGCDYGIWGGYSYNTIMSQNEIADSLTAGIAIEHGHDNWIEGNRISNSRPGRLVTKKPYCIWRPVGIWLWWDEDKEIADGVYGKNQNSKSERNTITRNRIGGPEASILLEATTAATIRNNDFEPTGGMGVALECWSAFDGLAFTENNIWSGQIAKNSNENGPPLIIGAYHWNIYPRHPSEMIQAPTQDSLSSGSVLYTTKGSSKSRFPGSESELAQAVAAPGFPWIPPPSVWTHPAEQNENQGGRETMVIGPWGPVDVQEPQQLDFGSQGAGDAVFWFTGPQDTPFRINEPDRSILEMEFTVTERQIGRLSEFRITPWRSGFVDYAFVVKCNLHREGRPKETKDFVFRGQVLILWWKVNFWQWTPAEGSDLPPDWDKLVASPPLKTVTKPALAYNIQGGAPEPGVPADHFATVATTEIELPAGSWKLTLTSDDGARLFVDGEKVIERWDIHGPTDDEYTLTLEKPRRVRLRVEHFENSGWAALALRIERP